MSEYDVKLCSSVIASNCHSIVDLDIHVIIYVLNAII